MAFTVTITQHSAVANGLQGTIDVVTGQSASPIGTTFSGAVLNTSFTPAATGSIVFGSQLGLNGTWTAETANSPYLNSSLHASLQYIQLRTSAALTGGTPVTLGSTSAGTPLNLALAEVTPVTTLAIDASSPGAFAWVGTEVLTSPSFTPPPGSLVVLMVASNGSAGVTSMVITDTSGLGLTWTQQAVSQVANDGYAGVWTALIPSGTVTAPSGWVQSQPAGVRVFLARTGIAMASRLPLNIFIPTSGPQLYPLRYPVTGKRPFRQHGGWNTRQASPRPAGGPGPALLPRAAPWGAQGRLAVRYPGRNTRQVPQVPFSPPPPFRDVTVSTGRPRTAWNIGALIQ